MISIMLLNVPILSLLILFPCAFGRNNSFHSQQMYRHINDDINYRLTFLIFSTPVLPLPRTALPTGHVGVLRADGQKEHRHFYYINIPQIVSIIIILFSPKIFYLCLYLLRHQCRFLIYTFVC